MSSIQLNGEIRKIPSGWTLIQLLDSLDLSNSEFGIAVCLNDEIISRTDWNHRILVEKDHIEIVNATQGG